MLVPSLNLSFSEADLRPLVEFVVSIALDRLETDRRRLGDKLAFSEPEAAALLGVRPHVLRDARLRGEIPASRVGRRIRYERDELLRYLRKQRPV